MGNFRYAIFGAGHIAGRFSRVVRGMEGFEICAVASKSLEKAENFAKENGIAKAYDSYAELLKQEKPDCVYIATTPDAHFALSKMCIENGTPVLCEKAMFVTKAEAEEVFRLAREKKVFVMEAMWSRFLPTNRKVKEWIESGAIGIPRFADIRIGFHADENPEARYLSPDLCGGATTDITVYTYELARFYFDRPILDMQISSVPASTGVDLTDVVTLNYGNMMATLTTTVGACLYDSAVIYGSKGYIEAPHPHCGNEAILHVEGKEPEKYSGESTDGFTYEIEEAAKAIREGLVEHPVVPHALTIDCADVFDRVYQYISDHRE